MTAARRVAPGVNAFPTILADRIVTPTTREQLDGMLCDLATSVERVMAADAEHDRLVRLFADSKFREHSHQHGDVATAKRRLDEATSNYAATHQAVFLALAALLPSETQP